MANKKRKNTYFKNLSKIGLLVLYFFLLAPQCHSRFYSIANFYRFSSHEKNTRVSANKQAVDETIQTKVKHLSLDKRFRNSQPYKAYLLTVSDPNTFAVYIIPRSQDAINTDVDILSDAHEHSLSRRGPPCA